MSDNKIWICIDLSNANEAAMDFRDAAPETNAKIKYSDESKDWHLIVADSIEDQAKRLRDCSCTDCKCGKEDTIKASVRVEKFGAKLESMLSSISSGNNHRGFGNTQQTG